MVLMLFTIIIYVFFVYGIIEFSKKLYLDIIRRGKTIDKPDIHVIVKDEEDLEYTIRNLRKSFNHIVLLLDDEIENIPSTLYDVADGASIEYIHIGELGRVREL